MIIPSKEEISPICFLFCFSSAEPISQKHKLISDKFDDQQKVVEFEHPDDLFKLLPLDISKAGCSDAELKSIR